MDDPSLCRRCHRPVVTSADQYAVFEQMHYVCFHYEFEHDPADVDDECVAGGCPSKVTQLRWTLRDWGDSDDAVVSLARALGIAELRPDIDWARREVLHDEQMQTKLQAVLDALVAAGLIESRHAPIPQYRWTGG